MCHVLCVCVCVCVCVREFVWQPAFRFFQSAYKAENVYRRSYHISVDEHSVNMDNCLFLSYRTPLIRPSRYYGQHHSDTYTVFTRPPTDSAFSSSQPNYGAIRAVCGTASRILAGVRAGLYRGRHGAWSAVKQNVNRAHQTR